MCDLFESVLGVKMARPHFAQNGCVYLECGLWRHHIFSVNNWQDLLFHKLFTFDGRRPSVTFWCRFRNDFVKFFKSLMLPNFGVLALFADRFFGLAASKQ